MKILLIFLCALQALYATSLPSTPATSARRRLSFTSQPTQQDIPISLPVMTGGPQPNVIPHGPVSSNASSNPSINLNIYTFSPFDYYPWYLKGKIPFYRYKLLYPHWNDIIGFLPIYRNHQLFLRPIKKKASPKKVVKKNDAKKNPVKKVLFK